MSDELFRFLSRNAAAPVVSRPPRERVVAGDPVFTTWNAEERGGLHCGMWQATPGKWRIRYEEWEYCRILEGLSVITEEGREGLVELHDTYRAVSTIDDAIGFLAARG